jgi:hypothetical protein
MEQEIVMYRVRVIVDRPRPMLRGARPEQQQYEQEMRVEVNARYLAVALDKADRLLTTEARWLAEQADVEEPEDEEED